MRGWSWIPMVYWGNRLIIRVALGVNLSTEKQDVEEKEKREGGLRFWPETGFEPQWWRQEGSTLHAEHGFNRAI